MSSHRLIRPLIAGCCLSVFLTSVASALHPYHASVAYVDVIARPKGMKRLEVALRVFPDDLENALRQEFDDQLRLTSKKIDTVLQKWLSRSFLVQINIDAKEKPAQKAKQPATEIQWVGKEVDIKTAWLYFEIDIPKGKHFALNNRVLFRQFDDQVNTVVVRDGKNKKTLQFSPQKEK